MKLRVKSYELTAGGIFRKPTDEYLPANNNNKKVRLLASEKTDKDKGE